MMIIFIIFGSLFCFYLKSKKFLTPVRASTLLTLISSLIINDPTSLALIYGGSFLGMSQPQKNHLVFFILGSFIYYLLFHYLNPVELGFGGTLGALAFVSSGMTTLFFKAINPTYE
jgi:hypothetical protein